MDRLDSCATLVKEVKEFFLILGIAAFRGECSGPSTAIDSATAGGHEQRTIIREALDNCTRAGPQHSSVLARAILAR